jgi:hypothetical protein
MGGGGDRAPLPRRAEQGINSAPTLSVAFGLRALTLFVTMYVTRLVRVLRAEVSRLRLSPW